MPRFQSITMAKAKKTLAKRNKIKQSAPKENRQVKSSKNKNIKAAKAKAVTKIVKSVAKKSLPASISSASKKIKTIKSIAKPARPIKKALPEKKVNTVKKSEPVKVKIPVKPAPKMADKAKMASAQTGKKQPAGKNAPKVLVPEPVAPRRNVYAIPTKSPNHDPKAKKKEPAGKFEIEYVVHTSPGILYEFFTSPSGLSEWFADDVNIKHGIYTFFWDGMQQDARVLAVKEFKYVRYQWLDKHDGSYFEFRIEIDDMTNDVSFIVTDFAEGAEVVTSKLLWDSQVHKLLQVIGAY